MLTLLYLTSLVIISTSALWLALDPKIPTGIIGSICLGGVAVFSVAAGEGDPPNWLVGQTGSLAGLCVWGASRVWWRRRLRGIGS
jgi:hypothetical protein